MRYIVRAADGTKHVIEGPEGATPDEIEHAAESLIPAAQTPSRWATLGHGMVKGAAGFGDMIGNGIVNTANLGIMGAESARQALTGKPGSMDDLIPSDALSGYRKMADAAGLTGSAPTDLPGRLIDFTGQAIGGGGVNPAALARNAASGAIVPIVRDVAAASASGLGAGVGSEVADNLKTGNASTDALVHALLTMGGGATPGMTIASRGTGAERASAATKGVTPQQFAAARLLAQKAADSGTPVTAYEAIQKITGLNPKMQTQQRVAEQSDAAANTLTPMMQQRPGANAALMGSVLDQIAPQNPLPDTLAGLLQKSASDAIRQAQKARTEAVSPFYQDQRASDIHAMDLMDSVTPLTRELAGRLNSRNDAVQQGGQVAGYANDMTQAGNNFYPVPGQPRFPDRYAPQTDRAAEANAVLPEFDELRQQRLSEAQQAQDSLFSTQDALAQKNIPFITNKVNGFLNSLDANIRGAGPTQEGQILSSFRNELSPNGNPVLFPSQLESIYKSNRDKLDLGLSPTPAEKTQAGVLGPYVRQLDGLIQTVSPDIAKGRTLYADISKNTIDPLQASQVGKLSRSDDFRTQAENLLPENPLDVTPSVIKRTVQTVGQQDPDIMRNFLGQYLRGTFNEANQSNMGGPPIYGGSKFAAKVSGNPVQGENLATALRESGADPTQFNDALDIFGAQGMKPPVNSATTANAAENSAMGVGGMLGAPLKFIQSVPVNWANGLAAKDLAKVLSSGGSTVDDLMNLARTKGTYNPLQQQMLVNLLMSNGAASQAASQGQ